MHIRYGCEISIVTDRPVPALCRIDIHPERRGDIVEERGPPTGCATARDAFGNILRRFTAAPGQTSIWLSGLIQDPGVLDKRDAAAEAMPVADLPDSVLMFLNGSRYCETDKMGDLAWNTFGGLPRTTSLVDAICSFTHERLTFDYQQARSTRTALEAYEDRVGVCRDFTHLAITLCRCMNIPARYVNGYLGDIGIPPDPNPMDFSAWFEAYLGGAWYTFDARHNQRRIGRLPIARGRDACDVPMVHTFGPHILNTFRVITAEVLPDRQDVAA
jgi:transglutaminase-like putative cysteine protease